MSIGRQGGRRRYRAGVFLRVKGQIGVRFLVFWGSSALTLLRPQHSRVTYACVWTGATGPSGRWLLSGWATDSRLSSGESRAFKRGVPGWATDSCVVFREALSSLVAFFREASNANTPHAPAKTRSGKPDPCAPIAFSRSFPPILLRRSLMRVLFISPQSGRPNCIWAVCRDYIFFRIIPGSPRREFRL